MVYVTLWSAQRELARGASPPERSAAQPGISITGVGQVTAPPGPMPDAATYVDGKLPRLLEDRIAALEGAADRTETKLVKLDGKVADVATVAKERIDQAYAQFERHYDDLKARQDAIWRAVQAREAELKLRSLDDEAAGLAKRLLRANAGDYTTDGRQPTSRQFGCKNTRVGTNF